MGAVVAVVPEQEGPISVEHCWSTDLEVVPTARGADVEHPTLTAPGDAVSRGGEVNPVVDPRRCLGVVHVESSTHPDDRWIVHVIGTPAVQDRHGGRVVGIVAPVVAIGGGGQEDLIVTVAALSAVPHQAKVVPQPDHVGRVDVVQAVRGYSRPWGEHRVPASVGKGRQHAAIAARRGRIGVGVLGDLLVGIVVTIGFGIPVGVGVGARVSVSVSIRVHVGVGVHVSIGIHVGV